MKRSLIILFFIVTPIFCITTFNLGDPTTYEGNLDVTEALLVYNYSTDFTNKYIKIQTVPAMDENPARILIGETSPTRKTADYISDIKGINVLFLQKEYFSGGKKNMSLAFECDSSPCNYTISFTMVPAIQLELDDENVKNTYSFNKRAQDYSYEAIIPHTSNSSNVLSIAVTGGESNTFQLFIYFMYDYGAKSIDVSHNVFFNGDAAIIKESDYDQYVQEGMNAYYQILMFSVDAAYITLSVRNLQSPIHIQPDAPLVSGYLNPSDPNININHECFNIDPDATTGSVVLYEISVVAKLNDIEVFQMDEKMEQEFKSLAIIRQQNSFQFNSQEEEGKLICVRPFIEGKAISYGIQVINIQNTNTIKQPNNALITNVIYKHYLMGGQLLYYRKSTFSTFKRPLNVNLKAIKGNPEMRFHRCETFPKCKYTDLSMRDMESPHVINDVSTYNLTYEINDTQISSSQSVIVVGCGIGEATNEDCEFEISFYNDNEPLLLKPDDKFTQYIVKEETDKYKLTITDPKVTHFSINLLSYSGDSFMTVKKFPHLVSTPSQYIVGHRQIIEYNEIEEGTLLGDFEFNVNSLNNSYYGVYYVILSKGNEIVNTNIPSGEVVLETISTKETYRRFTLPHRRMLKKPYIGSFFSINCKLDLIFNEKSLTPVDDLYQHELKPNDPAYQSESFVYTASIDKVYQSAEYENQLCLVEIATDIIMDKSEIVIPDNTPIQFTLDTHVPKIKYLYPITDNSTNIILNFVLEDDVPMVLSMKMGNQTLDDMTLNSNRIILLENDLLQTHCQDDIKDHPCNLVLTLDISNVSEELKQSGLKYEMSIKPVSKEPTVLKKRMQKEDVLSFGNTSYYVTEIGHEEGEVVANYNRGIGELFGKIVCIGETEQNPDWRNTYKLPTSTNSELKYNRYTQTLSYTLEQTEKCKSKGCLLLIGVRNLDQYHAGPQETDDYYLDYSIFVRAKDTVEAMNIVDVSVNEYIVGALQKTITDDEYHYYSLYMPHNSTYLYIDLQCDNCHLQVGFDKTSPEEALKNIKYWTFDSEGKDQIFTIEKSDENLKNVDNLKDTVFVFKISVNDIDRIYSTPYVLRFRAPTVGAPNIVMADADQETLCKIENDNDFCHLMIPANEIDKVDQFYVYVFSDEPNEYIIYAKTIDFNKFDGLKPEEKKAQLPINKSTSQFSNEDSFERDFLSVSKVVLKDDYILIGIKAKRAGIISMISSFRTNYKSTWLKPQTINVFHLENENDTIIINMDTQYSYSYSVTSLNGFGSVRFTEEPEEAYYLSSGENIVMNNNKTSNCTTMTIRTQGIRGYTVAIKTVLLSDSELINEVENNKQIRIDYNEQINNKLYFYSKISNPNENKLLALSYSQLKQTSVEGSTNTFEATGYVVNSHFIAARQRNSSTPIESSYSVKGIYDPFFLTTTLMFPKAAFSTNDNQLKYIFIEHAPSASNKGKFTDATISANLYPISAQNPAPIPPLRFTYGSFDVKATSQTSTNVYLIRKADKVMKSIKIELAYNSEYINYALIDSDAVETQKNSSTLSSSLNKTTSKFEYGRTVLFLTLPDGIEQFKISFFPVKEITNTDYSKYMFFFMNNMDESVFFRYMIEDPSINITYSSEGNNLTTMKVKVNKLVKRNNYIPEGTYYVNVYANEPKANLIFNTETPINSESVLVTSDLTFFEKSITNLPKNKTVYVNILARLNENYETLIYNTQKTNTSGDTPVTPVTPVTPDTPGSSAWWIIIIIIIVIVVLIVGIFLFIRMKGRNNSLNTKVERISFTGKDDGMTNLISGNAIN